MHKILIAAGGTGGHIYPALAMAEAFVSRASDTRIGFVGTRHGLENKIIPPKGFPVHHLSVGRLNSNVPITERVLTLVKLPWSLIESARLLRREKPDFVLGVGGHASGPLLLAASLLGYRTAIWEPNAMPGLANRWLARFVGDCWVVFDEARALLHNRRMHAAGMPVRQEIESEKAAPLQDDRFHILVFGGSQGARSINNAMLEIVRQGKLKNVHIVHQTGPADFARLKSEYDLLNGPVEVREYLHDMGDCYNRADLVVCRSGTGTLSELAACGKPAILIPFPFAADDHQRKNAESLVSKGAATMILHEDLSPGRLREEIERLQGDPEKRRRMSRAIRAFHQPRAAEKLVGEFTERIESHASR